jgi:hypothetical protein
VAELIKEGGYLCNEEEKRALRSYLWLLSKNGQESLNPAIIAQNADKIAHGAGFSVPPSTRFLIVLGTKPIESDRFNWEKLSPVLTITP